MTYTIKTLDGTHLRETMRTADESDVAGTLRLAADYRGIGPITTERFEDRIEVRDGEDEIVLVAWAEQ